MGQKNSTNISYPSEEDILNLAQDSVCDGLISEEVVNQLTSLHPQVPNSMRYKYLIACFNSELAGYKG